MDQMSAERKPVSVGLGLENLELLTYNAQGSEYELFLEAKLRTHKDRRVVVKQYHTSMLYRKEEDLAAIAKEMAVLIHLKPHPNLCAYLGVYEHDDHLMIVREFVSGVPLSTLIPMGVDLESQLRISIQLADAFMFLKKALPRQGVEFSDNPLPHQNILYNPELDRILLVDYQLTALQASVQMKWDELNRATQGMPLYPPELFRTGIYHDTHSTVYNLAIVLYAMQMKRFPRVRRFHFKDIKNENIRKLLENNIIDNPDARYGLGKWATTLRDLLDETIEESGKKIDIEYEEKVTLWMIWKRMQWMDIVKERPTCYCDPNAPALISNGSGLTRPGDSGPKAMLRPIESPTPSIPLQAETRFEFELIERFESMPAPPQNKIRIIAPTPRGTLRFVKPDSRPLPSFSKNASRDPGHDVSHSTSHSESSGHRDSFEESNPFIPLEKTPLINRGRQSPDSRYGSKSYFKVDYRPGSGGDEAYDEEISEIRTDKPNKRKRNVYLISFGLVAAATISCAIYFASTS